MALIEAESVSKTFSNGSTKVEALRNVSLTVGGGSHISIVGASGSGKSTLLHLLGILDQPTSGDVRVLGESTAGLDDEERANLRRTSIGLVFQSFQLLPALTAWENVALPGVLDGQLIGNLKSRSEHLLQAVGLGERSSHLPNEMSGGEQQRVAIARALFADPLVVLADEPTGALDSTTSIEVMELLERETAGAGKALVVVTHDLEVAERAQTQVTIRDGVIG